MKAPMVLLAAALLLPLVPHAVAQSRSGEGESQTDRGRAEAARDCSFTRQDSRRDCECVDPASGERCTKLATCVSYFDQDGQLCRRICSDCDYVCTHAPC